MDPNSPLAATALMHLVSDRKILSLAKVGCVESDDFVYMYSMEYLDEELLETCCAEALEDAPQPRGPTRTIISPWPLSYSCATQSPQRRQS